MPQSNKGRRGSTWVKCKANVRARREKCCRCGQAIDYTIPYRDPDTGEVNGDSFSVDHYPHPLDTHPHLAEDLSNLHAAHLRCNQSNNQAGATKLDLGEPSEQW